MQRVMKTELFWIVEVSATNLEQTSFKSLQLRRDEYFPWSFCELQSSLEQVPALFSLFWQVSMSGKMRFFLSQKFTEKKLKKIHKLFS